MSLPEGMFRRMGRPSKNESAKRNLYVELPASIHETLDRYIEAVGQGRSKRMIIAAALLRITKLGSTELGAACDEAKPHFDAAPARHRFSKDGTVSSEPLKGIPKPKVWEPEPKGKGKKA